MSEKTRITIHSEDDLKKHASTILRRINQSERDGLLFLLNPVFALKDAGFDLNPAMRRHLKRALRYGTDDKKRITKLEEEVSKIAGREVNAAADQDVSQLLFDQLKLSRPRKMVAVEEESEELETYESAFERDVEAVGPVKQIDYAALRKEELKEELGKRGLAVSGKKEELVSRLEAAEVSPAPRQAISLSLLESMREQHAVVPKLIELRTLLKGGWQFVNSDVYERVRSGATVTLLKGVKFGRRGSAPGDTESEGGA